RSARRLLAREPLEQLRLGRGADARHLAEPPLRRRGPELLGAAHAEPAADLDHPLRRQAHEAPKADELRLDVALELAQLRDLARLDELPQSRLDAGADPA